MAPQTLNHPKPDGLFTCMSVYLNEQCVQICFLAKLWCNSCCQKSKKNEMILAYHQLSLHV